MANLLLIYSIVLIGTLLLAVGCQAMYAWQVKNTRGTFALIVFFLSLGYLYLAQTLKFGSGWFWTGRLFLLGSLMVFVAYLIIFLVTKAKQTDPAYPDAHVPSTPAIDDTEKETTNNDSPESV